MLAAHLTPHLIARAERFQARFHAAHIGALADLPGNPFGVEICSFGDGVACKIRHPLLRGKNRIHGFGVADMDALDDLLHFYHEDGLSCSLTVVQGGMTEALFTHLTAAPLWSACSGTVPAIVPDGRADDDALPGVTIRRSGPEEKELYLDLFQQAFASRDEADPAYRAIQWAEDALPVRDEGRPAGVPAARHPDGPHPPPFGRRARAGL